MSGIPGALEQENWVMLPNLCRFKKVLNHNNKSANQRQPVGSLFVYVFLTMTFTGVQFFTCWSQGDVVADLNQSQPMLHSCADSASYFFRQAEQEIHKDFEAAIFWTRAGLSKSCIEPRLSLFWHRRLGQMLNMNGHHEEAKAPLLRAKELLHLHMDSSQMGTIMANLAAAYTYTGEYSRAFQILYNSLSGLIASPNGKAEARECWNLGLVYYKTRNYAKSLEFYLRSYRLRKTQNNHHRMASLLSNISLSYAHLDQYDSALKYLQIISEEYADSLQHDQITEIEFAKGLISLRIGHLKEAERSLKHSLKSAKEDKDLYYVAENHAYLAELYGKTSDLNLCKKHLDSVKTIGLSNNFSEVLLHVYKQYILLYEQQQNVPSLIDAQTEYLELKEKIYNHSLSIKIASSLATHYEKKYQEARTIQNKILLTKGKLISNQRLIHAVVITCLLGSVVALFLIKGSIEMKRKVNYALLRAVNARKDELATSHLGQFSSYLEKKRIFDNVMKSAANTRDALHSLMNLKEPNNLS